MSRCWAVGGWRPADNDSGYSSAMEYAAMGAQLARGYVTLATDTGHSGSDPDFAIGHPEAIVTGATGPCT